MKIVIVEDEQALSGALSDKFKHAGLEVAVANDGGEAVDVIRENKPDIIALDLLLPKKDGFEILEELKNDTELSSIPVIVLSNLDQDEDLKKALRLGAVDYWVKSQHPINEIVEKVNMRLLGKGR